MNFQKKNKIGDFFNSRIFLKFKAFESVLLLFFWIQKKTAIGKDKFLFRRGKILFIYYSKLLFQIVIVILIGRGK